MNLHFVRGEGHKEYPRKVFARIDQIEPPNPEAAKTVVIGIDAVPSNWEGFQRGRLLSLDEADDNSDRLVAFWTRQFTTQATRSEGRQENPFRSLPLYHVELTLPNTHPWVAELLQATGWLEFDLDDKGEVEVAVYGGLFSEPVTAWISHPPRPATNNSLRSVFDMDNWPDAGLSELNSVLNRRCEITQLHVLDIGQGSASAIVCKCGLPIYYFDVGCGVYRNAKTTPGLVQFCVCDEPVVILSHWDADHWAGALRDPDLLKMTWIAPRQSIGPRHTVFASSVLAAGGNILIFPSSLPKFSWGGRQKLELRRCLGASTDRNGSGLALVIENRSVRRGWLLTGDAPYDLIPGPLPSDLAAVVVPHHGADMGPSSVPPVRTARRYSRLLYSFGPGNKHGKSGISHPTSSAVNAHTARAWPHVGWLPPPPGTGPVSIPVIATAAHPNMHNDGAAVGWTSPPGVATHLSSCSKAMPVVPS